MSLKGLIKKREGILSTGTTVDQIWHYQRSNLKADADSCFGLFGPTTSQDENLLHESWLNVILEESFFHT